MHIYILYIVFAHWSDCDIYIHDDIINKYITYRILLSIHNILLHKCRKKQPSVRFGRWLSFKTIERTELDYVARFPRLFPGS